MFHYVVNNIYYGKFTDASGATKIKSGSVEDAL